MPWDIEREDVPDSILGAIKVLEGNKIPKMPDLSGMARDTKGQPASPFLLDSWGAGSPANTTKP